LIASIYLSKAARDHLAAALPARTLTKTRYSIPPLRIDAFDPPLHGLVIAEVEFGTDARNARFPPAQLRDRRGHRGPPFRRRTPGPDPAQGTHDLAEPPVALKRRASGGS